MKKAVSVGINLIVFASAAFASQANISVLSWNIRRGIGSNTPNSTEQTYLAKVVNYLNPDVWTINELGGNASGYNATSEKTALTNFIGSSVSIFGVNPVEGRDYFVYVGTFSDGFIGNAIVSRYKLTNQTSYYDGLRGLVHADVSLSNGASLGLFTQHLKATSNGSDSTSDSVKRQTEADITKSNLLAWKQANPGKAAVLTGDFNLSEDPGESDNWSAGNLGDILPGLGEPYHPITTLKSAGFLDGVPVSQNGDKDTIDSGSSNPRNRFDYDLYSNFGGISYVGGQVFNTAAYPIGHTPPGFTFDDSFHASDHLPVFVTYSVQAVPEPTTIAGLALGIALLARKRTRRSRNS